MRSLEIALVLPMGDSFVDGSTVRWTEIPDLAVRAESIGFERVWTADELLWHSDAGPAQGWWECVAMTGAVAAATSRIDGSPMRANVARDAPRWHGRPARVSRARARMTRRDPW